MRTVEEIQNEIDAIQKQLDSLSLVGPNVEIYFLCHIRLHVELIAALLREQNAEGSK